MDAPATRVLFVAALTQGAAVNVRRLARKKISEVKHGEGFFQPMCVCLLTDGQTSIDSIGAALQEHGLDIVKHVPAGEHWSFSGPSLVIAYMPEVNGYASVDVVNQPWPDDMGDPKSDSMTFAAWTMGHFGPYAYPGGLSRAAQHAWSWEHGRTVPQSHGGFIRIRLSYLFGGEKDAPTLPEDYDPVAEMMFLSRAALVLLEVPGVLCYFNPNGEVLLDRPNFEETLNACTQENAVPLPLWMNIRYFNLSEQFGFLDTVGNSQLDIRDIEAVFPSAKYDPSDIHYYLCNVSNYLLGIVSIAIEQIDQ